MNPRNEPTGIFHRGADTHRNDLRQITVLTLLKVFLVGLLLALVVLVNILSPSPELLQTQVQWLVLGIVVATFLVVLLTAWFVHRRSAFIRGYFLGQQILDLLLTTVLVQVSGGANSPYVVLYLVPVISSAIVFSELWAVAFTALSLILYYTISLLGWSEVIPHLEGQALIPSSVTAVALARRLSLNTSAFATVAALSIYLARRLTWAEGQMRDQSRELQALRIRHKDILESLHDGVLTLSGSGEVLDSNLALQRMLGEQWRKRGRKLSKLHPRLYELFQDGVTLRRMRLQTSEGELPVEVRFWDIDSPGALLGSKIMVLRDRTEVEALEARISEQEKLAALGRLTAGIAHEIRNPLASISGSLELLQQILPATLDEDARELLGIVFEEIERLNVLLKDLLQYARKRPIQRVSLEICGLVQEVMTLARSDPRAQGRELLLESCEEYTLSVDPAGLRQVLWNTITNALDADPESDVQVCVRRDEAYVSITVRDWGPGIEPGVQEMLFEPFFTTKERGTGLGLPLARRIAEQHDGTLTVKTHEDGVGTECVLRLPLADRSDTPEELPGEG